LGGNNRSIYLTESEKEFVNEHLSNFPLWVKDKLREEMELSSDACLIRLNELAAEQTKLKERLKLSIKDKKIAKEAYEKLLEEWKSRENHEERINYLSGKTGQKLLNKAHMNIDSFIDTMNKNKNKQTKL